jgi:hypothetical protein
LQRPVARAEAARRAARLAARPTDTNAATKGTAGTIDLP